MRKQQMMIRSPATLAVIAAASACLVGTSLAWTSPPIGRSSLSLQRAPPRLFLFSQDSTATETQKQDPGKTANEDDDDNNNWLATLTSSWEDSNDNNGLLSLLQNTGESVQAVLDETTDGWAMSYADLRPDNTQTLPGQAFLATNLAYLLAGLYLQWIVGDTVLGVATEVCALASFQYHYQQLQASGTAESPAVRWALLLDYVFAGLAIGLATLDFVSTTAMATTLADILPELLYAVAVTAAGLGCLTLSWKYEHGKPYMWWHSWWHVASAYAGFLIGDLHAVAAATTSSAAM